MANISQVDVLVVGAGPVGLLIGLGLQRMGISTCIVEKHEKSKLPMYGRACTLFPRTLEYLDQYELLDAMNQTGFIGRSTANFGPDGERKVNGGFKALFEGFGDTFMKYILNIRLKYSEEIFEAAYKGHGGTVLSAFEVIGFDVCNQNGGGYSKVHVKDKKSGGNTTIQSRFVIGADGAKSITRELAQITSKTEHTTLKWVRIDALITTDLPDSRLGHASIESRTHGNILYTTLDHGRSRIGFALTPAIQKKYGDTMTEEQVITEAKACMLPFKVEFLKVDWYTVYGIRQSVADQYMQLPFILAGDACHTHSSGTAQGMNTGVHDAINLTWKLAGVLKGHLSLTVLQTYETERRAIAQQLIAFDRTYSSLITGDIPPELAVGFGAKDVNAILAKYWQDGVQFQMGLGIQYETNILNKAPSAGIVIAGHRMPDVLVHKPGSFTPTRLYELMRSTGEFFIIVFAGEPLLTRQGHDGLQQVLEIFGPSGSRIAQSTTIPAKLITVIAGNKAQSEESMGMPPFGHAYYDHDASAHMRYGMSAEEGGVVVARPDGILGFACRLGECGAVLEYFRRLQDPQIGRNGTTNGTGE